MISSLLIANRGEIACRVIRTARRLGIRTVAVYSDADAGALHVRMADEAVHVGASPARASYLVGERIIAAAKSTGAEAIHPGYGFLSENAEFAQSVIDAGLVWVGPKPASIRAMGLKDAAKRLMAEAGVAVTPGYLGDDQSEARLRAEADAIGCPVLIKAVAGGGGKGMRLVERGEDFADALASCRREAAASFGDDRVLLEKYITRPRHIEVQVFGDMRGNIVHLFERDCSLQRRHQKVIEEAPAPGMDARTRESLCAAAVRAAKAVDYVGAGTIEFIADASEGLRADRIWFMEMNTRLQVEHPVTEAITGVDLVEWQLRVASGEALPLKQEELRIDGWAMEARLYAEDPGRGFLPSVGRLEILRLPTNDRHPGVRRDDELQSAASTRIDIGVEQGGEVSPFYDPMVAKLICHAEMREAAAAGLAAACAGTVVWPVRTNAAFLTRALRHPEFVAGRVATPFITEHEAELLAPVELPEAVIAHAAFLLAHPPGSATVRTYPIGFRLNAPPEKRVRVRVGDQVRRTPVSPRAAAGAQYEPIEDGVLLTVEGATLLVQWDAPRGSGAGTAGDGAILSPMPGRIIAVEVEQGQKVAKGQKLVTLEAMKMEHSLVAPFDGLVTELNARPGGQVQVEALLVRVTPA